MSSTREDLKTTAETPAESEPYQAWRKLETMARKARVIIEKGEDGFHSWCPELKGCQSQGTTIEETIANIKEALELYLETLSIEDRTGLLSLET